MPTAFVLIKCEDGAEQKIRKSFDRTNVRMDVHPTVGHYDLVAKITSPSSRHLYETIEKIHGNDEVRSTKVLLGVSEIAEAA